MGTPTDFAAKGCTGMRRPSNRAPAKIVLVALISFNSVSTLRRAPANAEHPSSSTCYYYGAISDLRSALALICYNFIVVQFASNISIAIYAPSGRPTCSTATAAPCCSKIEHNAGLTGAIGPSQAKVWRKSTDGRREQSEPPFSFFHSLPPNQQTNTSRRLCPSPRTSLPKKASHKSPASLPFPRTSNSAPNARSQTSNRAGTSSKKPLTTTSKSC